VRVVLPPHRDLGQLAAALTLLHVPLGRVLVSGGPAPPSASASASPLRRADEAAPSSLEGYRAAAAKLNQKDPPPGQTAAAANGLTVLPPGSMVYADLLVSVHATMRLAVAAAQSLHKLRPAVAPHGVKGYRDPADDLVICLEEKPLDAASAKPGGGGGAGTRVADWPSLRAALAAALPSDLVVSHTSFDPDSHAARELFKRAKLIVVPAGVVPSLLLAMFSSEGTPVLELVGAPSSQGKSRGKSSGGGSRLSSSSTSTSSSSSSSGDEGSGEQGGSLSGGGWAWTGRVATGLGLDRHPVHAASADGKGRSLFDPEAVATAAYKAMNYGPPPADDAASADGKAGGNDDGNDRGSGSADDRSFRDEVDDHGGRGREEAAEASSPEVEDTQFGSDQLSEETRRLVAEFGDPNQRVEVGLWDRDKLGELLQRLGDPRDGSSSSGSHRALEQTYATKGGAALGVEFGDFALQVLRRWVRCPSFKVLDRFAAPARTSGASGAGADQAAVDQMHALDQSAQTARLAKVRAVLQPWTGSSGSSGGGRSGVVGSVWPVAGESLSVAAAAALPDGSLSFAYLDGDHSSSSVGRELASVWPKLAPGGMLAGHDFTRAHAGVAAAVLHFARSAPVAPGLGGVAVFVTDVQQPRLDVRGLALPPCCPSWYLFKPLAGEGSSEDFAVESFAQRLAKELNEEHT
jgi:hypothetical protein